MLVLECSENARVSVGRRRRLDLPRGVYAYVGSALGPGGLGARVGRHLDPARPIHWHIDYLKRATRIVEVWYAVGPVRREHAWAKVLANLPDASIRLPGFGSSDCRCPAHLFHFATAPTVATFRRALVGTPGAGAGPVRVLCPPGTGRAVATRRHVPV